MRSLRQKMGRDNRLSGWVETTVGSFALRCQEQNQYLLLGFGNLKKKGMETYTFFWKTE